MLMTLSLNGQSVDDDSRLMYGALAVSLIMHLVILYALPRLETVKEKSPITIIAQLIQPPPPPQAESPKPVEPQPITQPEVTKQREPTAKPQVTPQPVLAAKQIEETATDYRMPETPQPEIVPNEPSAPVAPAVEESASAATASTSASTSSSSSNTPSDTTWDDSDVWDEFGRNLQALCERYKQYPEIARRRGWQGAGIVIVRFSAEGKTTSIAIEKSTGQKPLDDQALEMVRKSLNNLPLPPKFKGREFKLSIPVDFKLE
jgi:protein TonB